MGQPRNQRMQGLRDVSAAQGCTRFVDVDWSTLLWQSLSRGSLTDISSGAVGSDGGGVGNRAVGHPQLIRVCIDQAGIIDVLDVQLPRIIPLPGARTQAA